MLLATPDQQAFVATVVEVLPRLGLVYVVDDRQRTWGITRATPGGEIESLCPGDRVQAEAERVQVGSLIRRYSKLT
jgi:hypothetical protein